MAKKQRRDSHGMNSTMWAGVVDGRLYGTRCTPAEDPYRLMAVALYNSEAEARKWFEDVREVDLDEFIKPKK